MAYFDFVFLLAWNGLGAWIFHATGIVDEPVQWFFNATAISGLLKACMASYQNG